MTLLPKKQIIKSFDNTFCRIASSKIAGVGLIAIRDIPQDTQLFKGKNNQRWHTFKMAELKHLDPVVLSMIDDFYDIEKDGTVRIPEGGLNGMDMSYYLNTSDHPNIKTIDGGFTFVTIKLIKKGEELTVDYDSFD